MSEKNQPVMIYPNELVTVTVMNHNIEIQHRNILNTQATIKKLDNEHYMVIETGEIKEFKDRSKTRRDNINSMKKTLKKLRYLINNNFVGGKNELHVTLTYKENMTDTKRLYDDFDKFMKRLRYEVKGSLDYICVPEPQGRGAWHCHLLLRFNEVKKIFFDSNRMAEIWGHGFVKIDALNDVDNIGAYFSAYLADMELSKDNYLEAVEYELPIKTVEVEGQTKQMIKGYRLSLYPVDMKIIRKSKGILPPIREKMKYKDTKKIVGSRTPHYSRRININSGENDIIIQYEQYNMKK